MNWTKTRMGPLYPVCVCKSRTGTLNVILQTLTGV